MSEVEKVRRSIQDRKKKRGFDLEIEQSNFFNIEAHQIQLPQEIEKHGYLHTPESDTLFEKGEKENQKSLFQAYLPKAALALMLFTGATFVMESNHAAVEAPKKWVDQALTEDFQFAKANVWYEERFGKPLGIHREMDQVPNEARSEEALPVSGAVQEYFQANGTGILIKPDEQTAVTVVEKGVVTFAGNDKDTNKTVVVQHADGSKSTYGNLTEINVHLYQHVRTQDAVGKYDPNVASESVFFSIKKNNEFVDPVQVMQVGGHN